MGKLQRLLSLNIFKFLYYNFLCSRVKRDKGKYLLPLWHCRIDFSKSAKIYLHGHLCLNENKYPGSKAECYLRLRDNAELIVNGNVTLMYNGTIEVHQNALLQIGSCTIQSGSVIICAYKMSLGEGCLFSRMCYISDSDHHRILDEEGNTTNYPRETIVGDHVWIGVKATVMKGAKIKSGCVVGANSLVGGHIKEHKFLMSEPSRTFSDIFWTTEGFGGFHD